MDEAAHTALTAVTSGLLVPSNYWRAREVVQAVTKAGPTEAAELAPVRVNAVSPGVIDTPWWAGMPAGQRAALFESYAAGTPVGRIGRPEDVADAVLYLAGNGFVTGTVLDVSGGLTLARG